ncbi:hypothetical protein KFK09_025755 [Dendrobium nobile]|uniref:Uncharacterized protein n=1 Tax=Dendrobium nobile TaxID=94219 RepID=A0A8T3AAX2_DENNO|nr:hypothetical protein KFK09_025755 [Dendrobium nobile]
MGIGASSSLLGLNFGDQRCSINGLPRMNQGPPDSTISRSSAVVNLSRKNPSARERRVKEPLRGQSFNMDFRSLS